MACVWFKSVLLLECKTGDYRFYFMQVSGQECIEIKCVQYAIRLVKLLLAGKWSSNHANNKYQFNVRISLEAILVK